MREDFGDIHQQELLTSWKSICKTTDGCSFPPGFDWMGDPKIQCLCLQHDWDYRNGVNYGIDRREADDYLREGIKAAGFPVRARAMHLGVRLFGWQFFTSWRSYNEVPKKRRDTAFDSNRFL